ncbi:BRO-N domain-containing protein [Streptomyces herbicida]|uniref:BRO-N domain-containing protein n=1 Tax=Streptomyces herbicida TaxID=3065675 RepID=UPI00292D4921|nr:Bro-N domain-containing protein [Streptomyces sp. NEAU-HV9]
MYEHNDTPPEQSAERKQDAIDVNDFVFAATGARVRRLTLPDGEHWFPAADVAGKLGYANTRQALSMHVSANWQRTLREIAQGVCTADTLSKLAAHRLQRSMKLVNLKGLIQLVNGCTKPECEPFKAWVSEVIATIQRDGSYSLEPAPVQPAPSGGTAYLMPEQVADAIVRLEERNIRADEALLARQAELCRHQDSMARAQDSMARAQDSMAKAHDSMAKAQNSMADALHRIAHSLDLIADRFKPAAEAEGAPAMSPQQLLGIWRAKNLVVTDDVHAVAAYLAPSLVRGPVRCPLEEVAGSTGLTLDRVHDCVRMLLKRGCMRQSGCAADGAPVYVLP